MYLLKNIDILCFSTKADGRTYGPTDGQTLIQRCVDRTPTAACEKKTFTVIFFYFLFSFLFFSFFAVVKSAAVKILYYSKKLQLTEKRP